MNLTLSFGRRALTFEGTTDEYQLHVAGLVQSFWAGSAGEVESNDTEAEATHEASPKAASPLQMTARAVATALGGASGADLLSAAAAFLAVVEHRETFSRAQ